MACVSWHAMKNAAMCTENRGFDLQTALMHPQRSSEEIDALLKRLPAVYSHDVVDGDIHEPTIKSTRLPPKCLRLVLKL